MSKAAINTPLPLDVDPDEPKVLIRPRKGWFHLDLLSIWPYRELLYFLVWRELKVRYKQTAIGASWVILQPLLTMALLTVVFGNFAKVSSEGFPYPVFALAALLPWMMFSNALSRGSESIVGNANLVTKVYFPRLILPLSGALSPLVDFALSFAILIALMIWYGIVPTVSFLTLPLFILLSVGTALSVGVWLAALNVRYRDVRHTVPFLLQLWMFASPVAYPVHYVPENWRLIYGLNPMVGVIEGFRWAILGKTAPDFKLIWISIAVVVVLLAGGLVYFKQMESKFADEV
jgi:lipopolysaccharide transport system permease protein